MSCTKELWRGGRGLGATPKEGSKMAEGQTSVSPGTLVWWQLTLRDMATWVSLSNAHSHRSHDVSKVCGGKFQHSARKNLLASLSQKQIQRFFFP